MAYFRVASFYDDRIGHQKQTDGILRRLAEKRKLIVERIEIERPSISQQLKLYFDYYSGNTENQNPLSEKFDIFLGTGTHVHLPMLLYKKKYHVPVVTCMTPSTLLIKDFDLIFSPVHDGLKNTDNVFLTVGPPNSNTDLNKHEEKSVLILIGGVDENSHYWISDNICQEVQDLIKEYNENNIIISTSPRTPQETDEKLHLISENYENVHYFPFTKTPKGWLEKEYQRCRHVWVTGDSISMVYEALSSGCNVGIIPVPWKKKNNKFQKSEEYLRSAGMLIEKPVNWKNIKKKALNEAERCADKILSRWG